MKQSIIAWLIFFGGFSLEMGIDYVLRLQDENIRTGGIPEPLWFLIQIGLAVTALVLIYIATRPLRIFWKRLLVVGLQVGAGFFLYAITGIYYIVGTGIDTL